MSDINYFTCTLGQAALLPKHREYKSINDFIEQQAIRVPNLPAVGFYIPSIEDGKPWTSHILSFHDVHRGSCVIAEKIAKIISIQESQIVALICPSTANFLFLWLALMRLGHAVLLLAPQCSPSAIAHLCEACKVDQLFYDVMYEDLTIRSSEAFSIAMKKVLKCIPISSIFSRDIFWTIQNEPNDNRFTENVSDLDIAYLHHTSGTSLGTPKPIPQSHRAGVGVLPALEGRNRATFTTTPLYHGGIADLFRAWTSDALIWLFPGKGLPVTPANIVHCLEQAKASHNTGGTPPVVYFSSVPFILQTMAADKRGLKMLQSMEIVGVGGAALPVETGDKLVLQHVNLISRFGSAECGFLMSSHRDYVNDTEWQYLRPGVDVKSVSFEQRGEGLAELVVLPGWPHMAKKNRDGAFATADLFEPHHSIENAWKYHSRADSQLTLITGKKFDPAPLEAAMLTSNLLQDVLIFGDGRPYPGILLFRSKIAETTSDEDLLTDIRPTVEKINRESQNHMRLAHSMLVPMAYSEEAVQKSSKGTTLRRAAESRYASEIRLVYRKTNIDNKEYVADREVPSAIRQIITSVMGKEVYLADQEDLFSYGVDSVACIQIRNELLPLLPENSRELPLTVVEDCGSISKLAGLIVLRRHGKEYYEDNQQQLMLDMADKYSKFHGHVATKDSAQPTASNENTMKPAREAILLTGATGALGSQVLSLYLSSPMTSHIYLLVRGASDDAASSRVSKVLAYRKLRPLLASCNAKVTVLRSNLSHPTLGLTDTMYKNLAGTITVVHHIAWSVNFRLSLSSYSFHLRGLQNLINLALSAPIQPPKFIFCSSIASVSHSSTGKSMYESISSHTSDAGPLGYSRSKWVAEHMCQTAHMSTSLRGRIAVLRVGQLAGDSKTGIWSMSEAYPLMLAQTSLTKSLPNLQETLSWLPIDLAAKAFVEVTNGMSKDHDGEGHITVLPIMNADSTQWTELLVWVKRVVPELSVVEPKQFVEMLEKLQKIGKEHPAMRLIPVWKAAYGNIKESKGESGQKPELNPDMTRANAMAPILRGVNPVNEIYFAKIWNWIKKESLELDESDPMQEY